MKKLLVANCPSPPMLWRIAIGKQYFFVYARNIVPIGKKMNLCKS